jgi:hypothetical protein
VSASVRAGRQQELAAIALVILQMAVLHELPATVATLNAPPDAFERVMISTLILTKNTTHPVVGVDQLVPKLV